MKQNLLWKKLPGEEDRLRRRNLCKASIFQRSHSSRCMRGQGDRIQLQTTLKMIWMMMLMREILLQGKSITDLFIRHHFSRFIDKRSIKVESHNLLKRVRLEELEITTIHVREAEVEGNSNST